MSTQEVSKTRLIQLERLAEAIYDQMHISEPDQRASILDILKERYNTDKPFLEYESSEIASSRTYRANVRNTFIDILAYFAELRHIEQELAIQEQTSRQAFDLIKSKLNILKTSVVSEDDTDLTRHESFYNLDGRILSGTKTEEGILSLKESNVKLPGQIIRSSVDVYPVENHEIPVYHTRSGNIQNIISRGLNTGLWSTTVFTDEAPEMVWNRDIAVDTRDKSYRTLNGILVDMTLEFNSAIAATLFSGYFLAPARLFRAYAGIESGDTIDWQVLTASNTGQFLQSDVTNYFQVNTNAPTTKYYRFIFHVPGASHRVTKETVQEQEYTFDQVVTGVIDGQFDYQEMVDIYPKLEYLFGLYNLHVSETVYRREGSYLSEAYSTDLGAINGVSLSAPNTTEEQSIYYNATFVDHTGEKHAVATLPSGQDSVIHGSTVQDRSFTGVTENLTTVLEFPADTIQEILVLTDGVPLALDPTNYTLYHHSVVGFNAGVLEGQRLIISYTVSLRNQLCFDDGISPNFWESSASALSKPVIRRVHPEDYSNIVL